MRITSLELKNFRCFTHYKVDFNEQLSLIKGPNGSGKSSILEAMHYASLLKSFRTSNIEELIATGSETTRPEAFFMRLDLLTEGNAHDLQIGYSPEKRNIKLDNAPVKNYKELVSHFRAITVIEDDIGIVTGAPEYRRTFLDNALALTDSSYPKKMALYRKILKQRNSFLSQQEYGPSSSDLYEVLTEQLWYVAQDIRSDRQAYLLLLEAEVNMLIERFLSDTGKLIQFTYTCQEDSDSSPAVWMAAQQQRERYARRTLFGPHIDDVTIVLGDKLSRRYASRGQQKLIALLIKIAQFTLLKTPVVFALDDFMTDFDDYRLQALLNLLITLNAHVIFTVPLKDSALAQYLSSYKHDLITLP